MKTAEFEDWINNLSEEDAQNLYEAAENIKAKKVKTRTLPTRADMPFTPCVLNGPKVGSVSLSPRGDWRMPSDADMDMWHNNDTRLNDVENSHLQEKSK